MEVNKDRVDHDVLMDLIKEKEQAQLLKLYHAGVKLEKGEDPFRERFHMTNKGALTNYLQEKAENILDLQNDNVQ